MATPIPDRGRMGVRLSGEPDDSSDLEDIRHWRNTYKELALGFAEIAGAESGTRRRARDLQVRQLRDRLAFWERRWRELSADQDDLDKSWSDLRNTPLTRKSK